MPTDCEPWPGNSSASVPIGPRLDRAHQPQQHADPHTRPAPKAVMQDHVAGLDPALADALVERDRDRGRRGVAVAVHVLVDLARVDLQPLADGVDDAQVGLVRDEEVDLLVREALLGQQLLSRRRPSP